MFKRSRILIVLLAAIATGAMAANVAAQDPNAYILRVGLVLSPAGEITGGKVCFENDFGKQCQNLVTGVPTGYYEFDNITGDTGAVFVEGADPYEGSMGVVLNEGINFVNLQLTLADTPTPTPAPNLPDTGAGTTSPDSTPLLLITGLLGAAGTLAAAAAVARRSPR